MSLPDVLGLTRLLQQASSGDAQASEELIAVVYPELKRLAAQRLRYERANHTLQPTALANEAYVRLFGANNPIGWQDRAHFYAIVARKMRFILVDHARKKHQANHVSVSLDDTAGPEALGVSVKTDEDLMALDEALRKLAAIDERAALGVELRFFGGLTLQETAAVLKVDPATIKRDWVFAKAWLFEALRPLPKSD